MNFFLCSGGLWSEGLWSNVLWIGIGATLCMDAWAILQKQLFKLPSLDYALVGRWAGLMLKGQFAHDSIASADKVRGEKAIGWILHYGIGIIFAFMHIAFWGEEWVLMPTFGAALLTGIVTTIVPYFIMQPAFGMGFAAYKTPAQFSVCMRSMAAHTAYGIGIYLAAVII